MLAELQAIQLHLWILTAIMVAILVATGYCNYSRIKAQNETTPYEYMKYLSESEQFKELRQYATNHLKTRPNSAEALFFNAEAHIQLKNFDLARSNASKLASSSPTLRNSALTFIEMIDELESGI